VRSVTTREPEWTEQDRAEVLALSLYRDGLCPCGCGQPSAKTLIPEAEGPGWLVTETTCTARLALEEAQAGVAEKRKYPRAGLWLVQPGKR
jgi:hypothetical protein